jgi:hypothetical protein
MKNTDSRGHRIWSDEEVDRIVQGIPDLFDTEVAQHWAKKIEKHQGALLGTDRKRSLGTLVVGLGPAKRLRRQLEASRLRLSQAAEAVSEPEAAEPTPTSDKHRRSGVRLRMVEWTALAHHEEVKPLLDKKLFVTPNQLINALVRAQKEALPSDRWRDAGQWHSAFYRATRSEGAKRDAMSMLREGIKFQPLARFEKVSEPEPVHAPTEKEEAMTTAPLPQSAADPVMLAIINLFGALQERAERTMAPVLERLERMEARLAALPEDVRLQVADVVGGPAAAPVVETPVDAVDAAPTLTHERQPRVDVVGLLNGQVDVVKRACGRQWNLRFLSAEEVERQPITAPDAIMLRRFVSHSAQERIKKAGAKLHYANGAAESVIARLNQLYAARLN